MNNSEHTGPLHLQKYLSHCSEDIAATLRSAIEHPITLSSSLHCNCAPSGLHHKTRPGSTPPVESPDSIQARTRTIRRSNITSAHQKPVLPGQAGLNSDADQRLYCRFFSVQLNDEEGIVHAHCRRCERLILLYDRMLYWGTKRPAGEKAPETFPYRCSCGGHMFEICMGFLYPEEALDENDLDTITIAVRCPSCNELAIIFDDEAT